MWVTNNASECCYAHAYIDSNCLLVSIRICIAVIMVTKFQFDTSSVTCWIAVYNRICSAYRTYKNSYGHVYIVTQ